MSILDKINESISENDDLSADFYKLKTINDQNIQENKKLKNELDEAQRINEKHHKQIEELKTLIKNQQEYNEKLITSYNETITSLKSEITFEKEINEKYLTKIINSNNTLLNDFNTLNKDLLKNDEEMILLLNDTSNNLINSTSRIVDGLNDINQSHQSFTNNNEDCINFNNKLLVQINDHKEQLNKLEKSITDNSNQVNDNIYKTSNENDYHYSNILNQINSLIEYTSQSTITNSDITKIEIFNRISEELKMGNYDNLIAYNKIKELDLFDEVFYKEKYNYDLDIDPLLHFIYKGYEENKKPSAEFEPLYYKKSHENIKSSTLNPLVYFVNYGINEGNFNINEELSEIKYINMSDVNEEIEKFNIRGVKKSKRKPRLMVSLTTTPKNINNIHYTLYSLLNQQLKADKVMLWLNKKDFSDGELDLPKKLLKLKQNGLTIRFSEDNLNNYNNIISVLTDYPNDILITAKENIYYPKTWLKTLYEEYKNNDKNIITINSKRISINKDKINNYNEWSLNDINDESYINYPNSANGILCPPNTLYEDVRNKQLYNRLCKNTEDLWLWAMAVLNNSKIKNIVQEEELTFINPLIEYNKTNNSSDIQKMNSSIINLTKEYPKLLEILMKNKDVI